MPRYIYTAKSSPNEIVQGDIEAESEQEAIHKLTQRGYFPLLVKPDTLALDERNALFFKKISAREIIVFTRQLSNLIESGVNIVNSLTILSEQAPNKYLKIILNEITGKIKDGKSLSESLASYPYLFSSLYASMVQSGEAAGNIGQTLKRLADFLEKEEGFRNSIHLALIYPFFVFVVGVLTVVVLLGFVIPRLVSMFEDMGQMLPLPTRILIGISDFLRRYWWSIAALISISVFLLRRAYRNPQGRLLWDGFKLKTIILGKIILKTEISRLMYILSLLLSSGITIVSALEISTSVIENQILRLELQKFKDKISNGLSFSHCLSDSKLFPPLLITIVTVGEETGALEKSLLRISEDYEKETDRSLKTLTQLLDPIIILGIGLIVGFIVLSMLLPIFQINLIVK